MSRRSLASFYKWCVRTSKLMDLTVDSHLMQCVFNYMGQSQALKLLQYYVNSFKKRVNLGFCRMSITSNIYLMFFWHMWLYIVLYKTLQLYEFMYFYSPASSSTTFSSSVSNWRRCLSPWVANRSVPAEVYLPALSVSSFDTSFGAIHFQSRDFLFFCGL